VGKEGKKERGEKEARGPGYDAVPQERMGVVVARFKSTPHGT
jgi:hypothetical protein